MTVRIKVLDMNPFYLKLVGFFVKKLSVSINKFLLVSGRTDIPVCLSAGRNACSTKSSKNLLIFTSADFSKIRINDMLC
jgi:hypothetical protein